MLRKRISTARLHGIVIALIVGSLVSSVLGQTLGYALGQHIEASAGGASVGGSEHNAGALDGAHGGQTKKQPSVPRPITVPVLQGQQDDARHGERRHGDDGDDGDDGMPGSTVDMATSVTAIATGKTTIRGSRATTSALSFGGQRARFRRRWCVLLHAAACRRRKTAPPHASSGQHAAVCLRRRPGKAPPQ